MADPASCELWNTPVFGRTALHVAARGRGNAAAFLALLELGAERTALDNEGKTPMDYARENPALRGLGLLGRHG